MISFNWKHALLTAGVVLGSAFAGPAVGQAADSEALYHYVYFDANYEEIGRSSDYCSRSGINRSVTPTGTVYVSEEFYAYCRDGQLTLN